MKIFASVMLWMAAFAVALPLSGQTTRADKDYELGAFNLAVRSYLESFERRPATQVPAAMARLADSYAHLNQMEEARTWYERLARERRLEGEFIFKYGQVLMALGEYEKAREQFVAYGRANREDIARANQFAQNCTFAINQQGQSGIYQVNNEYINTLAADFGPAFFGDQVIFSSARMDVQQSASTWTGKAVNQLFAARVGSNGYLEAPVLLQRPNRETFAKIGPLSFSSDGKTVAYTKNTFMDGTRQIPHSGQELSIVIAQLSPNGDWVEDNSFRHNSPSFSTAYPSFSPDGNALYFASDRPDGYGGFDLYVSYRMGNTWSTPENLGPNVNTPGHEITPFFDGSSLFFSSDWHQGLGGFDIFRAEQANDRWTRIFHLGNLVNSSYDDYGFIYDSRRNLGYIVSNRPGGKGNEDIYKVFRSADNIVLRVRNASNGAPVPNAFIDFISCGEGLYRADAQGVYQFQAAEGLNCDIAVRAEGYNEAMVRVSTMSVRQNRELEVHLIRQGEEYYGKILNYASRAPVAGVVVSITNQATNTTMETTSDANGEYALALSPNSSYAVRYSRPGFRELDRKINTAQEEDRSILGIISMLPVNMGPNEMPPVVETGTLPATTATQTTTEPAIPQGFAVQVAALARPSTDGFANLAGLGQVYSKFEDGKYKIRVGVFADRAEANRVMNTARSQGYQGAFVVAEPGTVTSGAQPRGVGATAPAAGTTPTATPAAAPVAGRTRFAVQLGAYRNPEWFNPSGLDRFGTIFDGQRDNLTIKYLGYFDSEEQAKQAWQQARAAGFSTAFVVQDAGGGQFRKVFP
jgi:cell division septation protein DedD